MHEDEKKVRDAWGDIEILESLNDKPYWIASNAGFMGTGPSRTTDEMWSAAAAFTDARKRQIAEIDEEITEVEFISRYFLDERLAVWQRILASRQAARAELRRGMRGEA